MSIAYQADIFCDGDHTSCLGHVVQGEVYHHKPTGAAPGAWKVADSQGWLLVRGKQRMLHYCPNCYKHLGEGKEHG
ncbi:hypothetical protein NJC38_02540 [Pseudomonas sp. 21LCFQ010]|uniref:hypothetical protein n=1 Tax=Pseudomonas sp. 21LCFQ010 TaxID=2957506 RepID=UPI00209823E2|nr:hypothetical protein [Pseudomonas sp. 21LCFQ010]MCO8161028.1 hypothetical protein [Pseudomonas sp. 21LCFQ010]